MSKYQLTYFSGRGRAELARWVLAAAGQDYEDIRITREEWPAMKPTTPLGQLPVLTVDGNFKLGQSIAIATFLAKRFGFLGKDEIEQAKCQMVLLYVEDMLQAVVKIYFGEDEAAKAAAKKKWEGGQRDEFLSTFEKLLLSNDGGDGYFIGDGITVADMCFCIHSEYFVKDDTLDWSKFPKLKALKDRVEKENKNIADWIARRPVTQY